MSRGRAYNEPQRHGAWSTELVRGARALSHGLILFFLDVISIPVLGTVLVRIRSCYGRC